MAGAGFHPPAPAVAPLAAVSRPVVFTESWARSWAKL